MGIVSTVDTVHNRVVVPTVGVAGELVSGGRIDRYRIAKAFGPELAATLTEKVSSLLFRTGWNRFWEGVVGLGVLTGIAWKGQGLSSDSLDMWLHYAADLTTAWMRARPGEMASFANDMQVLGRNFARGNFGVFRSFNPLRNLDQIKSAIPSFGKRYAAIDLAKTIESTADEVSYSRPPSYQIDVFEEQQDREDIMMI